MIDVAKIEAPISLSDRAYEAIKESLLKMDLTDPSVEDRIDERGLAAKLGVSRTPLREAINRLVVEGFLRVVPRKGIYVVKKSKQEIVEILLIRAALEGLAARLATQHATEKDIKRMKKMFAPFHSKNGKKDFVKFSNANVEFHELVLKLSHYGVLINMASSVFDHMRWIRTKAAGFEERFQEAYKGHMQIIKAIEERKPDLAEKYMRTHIEKLAHYIEEKVEFPA
jgi:DNA-binding GntR family transcriptional regulator